MVELTHSTAIKKRIKEIKEELSRPDNKYGKKIITVSQVGSTTDTVGKEPKYEDNESSDVDLIFVGNTNYLTKNKSELEEYIGGLRSKKVQVWLKSEAAYKEPEKYFRSGHPANEPRVLDGWDWLGREIGRKIEILSGKTIWGKKFIEDLRKKSLKDPNFMYIPSEEGYELDFIAKRDLLKGLYGRNINSGIKSLAKEGIDEKTGKEAFYSYLNKKRLPKKEQNLTNAEKLAKDYILTKDNEIAKATLREFLGVIVQAKNEFISRNPHKIYEKIKNESRVLLDEKEVEQEKWIKLLDKAYKVKINKEIKENNDYDCLWNWDWTGKNIKENKNLVELVTGFFKDCSIHTSEQSHLAGYTWTQDFQERISYHLSRRAPGIIDILAEMNEREFETLEDAIDLYIGEMVNIFSNKLSSVSLDDKLKVIPEHKEATLGIIEKTVKKYNLPGEIKVHYKDRLLQIGQMQLILAQSGKEEYYQEAKKTFDMIFMDPKENVFSIVMPPRKTWNFNDEALAYLGLGECLLGLNEKKEAIKSLENSIKINPRDSYAWELLTDLYSSKPKRSRLYERIANGLKNPEELLPLRAELESDDVNTLERKLYSPWRKLISNSIDKDIENISVDFLGLLREQKSLIYRIDKKEDDMLSIIEHLNLIENEKSKLKDLISDLTKTKRDLRKFGGENYSKIEKIITKHKRNTIFQHKKTMTKQTLTNLTANFLKEKEELESKLKRKSSKSVIKKYIEAQAKLSFTEAREKLDEFKRKDKIDNKTYKKLYSMTRAPLPEELKNLKEELNHLNI